MGSQILRTGWEFSVEPRITRRVTLAGGTLLVLVALALMTVYLDPAAVLEALEGADPTLVGIAALVYLLSWPVRGLRYRDILAELGHDGSVGFLTGAIFISQTGNLVFPARAGDAVRAYVVKARRGVPYPSGFASLAVERVFDLLTITALGGATLVVLSASGYNFGGLEALPPDYRQSGRTALQVSGLVAGIAVFGLLALVVSARTGDGTRIRRLVGRFSNDSYADDVASVLERFVGDMQAVASDRRAFARVGATSLLVWTLDVITAAVVFAAFDVGLAPLALLGISFFAVSVGNLAKVLPLSPGGIGLYEGAFTLLVVALTGIAWPVALAAAIVDHAVKNLVTVVGGVVSTLALNVSLTEAVEEASDIMQTRSLVVLVSDFMDDQERLEDAVHHLREHDVILVQVLEPGEIVPEMDGDLLLTDSETGEEVEVYLPDRTRKRYRGMANRQAAEIGRLAREVEGDHLAFVTSSPPLEAMFDLVSRR